MPGRKSAPARRLTLPRTMRLGGARQFERVRAARISQAAGPIRIFAYPNELPHCRIGLAVPRVASAGGAIRRNRIKRLIREAFRLIQHEIPGGYDVIVTARAHEPLPLAEYQRSLRHAICELHSRWIERQHQ